jgi:hypothetical protein
VLKKNPCFVLSERIKKWAYIHLTNAVLKTRWYKFLLCLATFATEMGTYPGRGRHLYSYSSPLLTAMEFQENKKES